MPKSIAEAGLLDFLKTQTLRPDTLPLTFTLEEAAAPGPGGVGVYRGYYSGFANLLEGSGVHFGRPYDETLTTGLRVYYRFPKANPGQDEQGLITGTYAGAEAGGRPLTNDPTSQSLLLTGASNSSFSFGTGQQLLGGFDQATVCFWFMPFKLPDGGDRIPIVDIGGTDNGLSIYIMPDNTLNVCKTNWSLDKAHLVGPVLQPYRTYFVAVRFDGQAPELALFVDGSLEASTTATYSVTSWSTNTNKIGVPSSIAYHDGNNLAFQPFYGLIAEFRVYNIPLSNSDIQTLYNAGLVRIYVDGRRWIKPDQFYGWDYTGPISGTWQGIANTADYKVNVRVLLDMWYDLGLADLNPDGTWTSPLNAGPGFKEIRLVRTADNSVVDYGHFYLRDYYVFIGSLLMEDQEYDAANWTDKLFLDDAVNWTPEAIDASTATAHVAGYVDLGNTGYPSTHVREMPRWRIVGGAFPDKSPVSGAAAVASFLVPPDDPVYNQRPPTAIGYLVNNRAWIYDQALATLAYLSINDVETARRILLAMKKLQYPEDYFFETEYGGLPFSFDRYVGTGSFIDPYTRAGTIAWVAWAAGVFLARQYDPDVADFLEKLCIWLYNHQVKNPMHPQYGLVRIGRGRYRIPDYTFTSEEQTNCGTEHNLDAFYAFRMAYLVLGDPIWLKASDSVGRALLCKLYDPANNRFVQGIAPDGTLDAAWALDCLTWAGSFLITAGMTTEANAMADQAMATFGVQDKQFVVSTDPDYYNTEFGWCPPTDGVKPYADVGGYYSGDPSMPAPDLMWTEGTLGLVLLLNRLGRTTEANDYLGQIEKLRLECTGRHYGGLVYVTAAYRQLPWEFAVWPSVVGSCWYHLTVNKPEYIFPDCMIEGVRITVGIPGRESC